MLEGMRSLAQHRQGRKLLLQSARGSELSVKHHEARDADGTRLGTRNLNANDLES
jgi:hypothetical protein